MPTMVMAQPPKSSGNVMRKRKGKNDKILPISYMYVGSPKKKFVFYVRERMVYRSNVEVTYDDVYNYLASTTNDQSVSLHYSINGQYIPITTTGQLHTFIQTIHNDPTAFLYVENADYVWNVSPQNKSKMAKRNPTSTGELEADEVSDEQEDEEDEENSQEDENSQEETQADGEALSDEENSQAEDEEDLEDEDEEEDEEEQVVEEYESEDDSSSRMVIPERIPLKEAFVETKLRALTKKKESATLPTVEESPSEKTEGAAPSVKAPRRGSKGGEAYEYMKDIIASALQHTDAKVASRQVAGQLVQDVWGPGRDHDAEVFNDTVELLQASIGGGLTHYYGRVLKKFDSETPEQRKGKHPLDTLLNGDQSPAHDSEFLVQFLESATIAACDMLEVVQHLKKLNEELDYLVDLAVKLEQDEKNNDGSFKMPDNEELVEHMFAAVTSAQWGFKILNLQFAKECSCGKSIQLLIMELEKMTSVTSNMMQKTTSPDTTKETKQFVIESLEKIIGRFRDNKCTEHETVRNAIEDAEAKRWSQDTLEGNHAEWAQLRERGENRLNVSSKVNTTMLERPPPFTKRPILTSNPPAHTPVAYDLGGCVPSNCLNSHLHPEDSCELQPKQPIFLMGNEKVPAADRIPLKQLAPPAKALDSTAQKTKASTPATTTSDGQAASTPATTTTTTAGTTSGSATVSKTMSAELRKLIDNMYKTIPPQHNHVYPTPPKAGSILIPTGGLARCRCSKNCTEFLMEPAYEYIDRFNEPRQTVWEKTKQKRFKKN